MQVQCIKTFPCLHRAVKLLHPQYNANPQLQSASRSIGSDNHVIKLYSFKRFGPVVIRQRRLEGSTVAGRMWGKLGFLRHQRHSWDVSCGFMRSNIRQIGRS